MEVEVDELESRLQEAEVITLGGEELARLLGESSAIREVDPGGGRVIRVLRRGDAVLFQEETPEGKLLLRRLASEDQAERLLAERLASYERMWDGCGCKIAYFE